jgi:hypothetical protein
MTKIGSMSEGYLPAVPTNRLLADYPGTRYGVSMISWGLVVTASRLARLMAVALVVVRARLSGPPATTNEVTSKIGVSRT